ncbi:hypothetical protein Ancab_038176 [Ancistrocladus abbreviatus]
MDNVAYTKIVQLSTKTGSLVHGKLAHAHMIKTAFIPSLFLLNNILNMYCKFGELGIAQKLFDKIPKRDTVTWNMLISGYSQMGIYNKAMAMFREARMSGLRLDKYSYSAGLSVCAQTGELNWGMLIHGLIIVNGLADKTFLINSLIDMYSKCWRVDKAKFLFENCDELDAVSWNSLVAGYARSGHNEEVLWQFVRMQRCGVCLGSYVVGNVLSVCKNLDDAIEYGRMVHSCLVKTGLDLDLVVGTALLDMYAKNGDLDGAILIFKVMPTKNVVMYNALIAGYVHNESTSADAGDEPLILFFEMQRKGMMPSMFTFSSILKTCCSAGAFDCGKQIHAQIFKSNLQSDEFIGSALVELYSLSGSVYDALKCFDSTSKLDNVSWTSMISCYVQNGECENAFALFQKMMASGGKPDEFIVSAMLSACAITSAARSGEQIRGYSLKTGMGNFIIVKNSEICMYAESGDINSAYLTFKETEKPDTVSWSAMIHSHAQHGRASEALVLFDLMKDCQIPPNEITFLGVLTACSHAGLVDKGLRSFESMKEDHGMTPNVKHYASIVDLLSRAGRLADAEKFIMTSGFRDNPIIWRALLSACRVHKDSIMGQRVAEKVIELEPQAAASYVLLWNIYNDAGIKVPATEIRDLMSERSVRKEPGLSWIEIGKTMHSFVSSDVSHPRSQCIYSYLEALLNIIKEVGCKSEAPISYTPMVNGITVNYHSGTLSYGFSLD